MPRSHAEAPALAADRVRRSIGWWWRALTGNPLAVVVAFGTWLAGFLGSMFVLQSIVWDWLVADVPTKLPESVTGGPHLLALTPFDVIVVQAQASAIVGLLAAAPTVAYFARDWLGRRRESTNDPLAGDTVVQAVFVVLAVVALAVGLAYEYVVPRLFVAFASEGVGLMGPSYWATRWLEYVLLVGLTVGLSTVAPFLTATLARAGVVRPGTVVGDATQVGLGLATFGLVFWPHSPIPQALWLGPLLASLLVSVVVCRVVASGDGSKPIP